MGSFSSPQSIESRSPLPAIFVVLAFVSVFGFGIGKIMEGKKPVSKTGPQPLPGYGFPKTIRVSKDKWETLVMRDMGWQMECPPDGTYTQFDFSTWQELDLANLDQFTGSNFPQKNGEYGTVTAYVYKAMSTYRPTDFPVRFFKRIQAMPHVHKFASSTKTVKLDGVSVSEYTASYEDGNKPLELKMMCVFSKHSVRLITNVYPASIEKKGRADFDRMLASLKFIPNQNGTKWATDPKTKISDPY